MTSDTARSHVREPGGRHLHRDAFAALGILAIAAVSAGFGAAAGCRPVGSSAADHVLTGLLAAVVVIAAATASPKTLLVGSAIVAVAAGDSLALHLVGLAALAVTVLVQLLGRRERLLAALIGAVIVQAMLRLHWTSPTRGSAVVAFVGLALIILSGVLGAPAPSRRIAFRVAWISGAIVIVAMLASIYAVTHSRTLLTTGEAEARAAVDAARSGDRKGAARQFAIAQRRFEEAGNDLGSWLTWPARQLPLVGPQLRVLDQVATLGARTIPVARAGITKVNLDRLRMVNGRLDLDAIASYKPVFDEVVDRTGAARKELARISRMWLVPQLTNPLEKFATTLAKADYSAHTGADTVALAPSLLGADGPRNYLLAIVTPAEARGGGGLMANYGVLRIADGRLHLAKVGRGPDLNAPGVHPKHLSGPPDYLARYAKFEPAESWENVTMSPDFPSVANVMAQLYPQSGGIPIDGVIRLDPVALSGLLSLTGPVHVPGLPITLDSDNVVNFLLRDEYVLITDNKLRSNLLGDVARAAFDRLTTGKSPGPARFGRALSPAISTGNFALWFRDARSQALVRRIGADAAMPENQGDSFGLTVQNGGGNKIDEYLQRTVDYRTTITPTGAVQVHAVISLHNGAPATGLPKYVIGNPANSSNAPPDGTNRLYLSMYSALALERATLDGRPFALLAEGELRRNVYSAFLDIPSRGTRTIELDLGGSVNLANGHFRFDYIPQPLPLPDEVRWSVRAPGAQVVSAAGEGAEPIHMNLTRNAASTRTRARGRWSIDVRLRR